MSDIVWPDSLPAPLVDGYAIAPDDGVVRTQMDSGLARQRRIFTQTPTRFRVRWLMNDNQFYTFRGWYVHFAQSGAALFQIDLKSGEDTTPHTVRFLGAYQHQLAGQNLHTISATLEAIDTPVVSKGYLDIALNNDMAALYASIDRYGQILNQTLTA